MNRAELFVAEIGNRIRAGFEPKAPTRRESNYASDLDHPCNRNLVYARLNWKERKMFDIEAQFRMDEGNRKELEVKHLLERSGFVVEATQVYTDWDEYQIRGKIDGKLVDADRNRYPWENKAISPYYWDSARTIEDMKKHSKWWIRKIPSQLNNYLFMEEEEFGVLTLVTWGKVPRVLAMEIDYELGEKLVKKAEVVNGCVARGELPDRIEYDGGVCGLCGFEHICKPVKPTEMEDFKVPKEAKEWLKRYFELKEDVKEYEFLKKTLIGSAKKPGFFHGRNLLVEDFEIKTKKYDMVQKAREEKTIPVVKTTISKLDQVGE